ncbi:fumarate hydratase [Candidatus Formimonas warabiya]|uniref:Fumarate hydratase n=1 Tax=Formimonas warabiya TaxID=1761012 RepID=A0A3G1KRC8_FORW1|nr:fumarate hydratase [Candidatus Formimonas warabiya]ATW24996.1 fumarate hydratase [Candidatus Formimonas warabiya]
MKSSYEEIVNKTAETLIKASNTFRPDQIQAYRTALAGEENSHARWVLETVLENALIAEEKKLPLCDDTGIPHVFLEIGSEVAVPPNFFRAVEEGVAKGLHLLPGRPMAVRGNDIERISQSAGMSDDPAALALAPIQVRTIPGDAIKLTVLMMGGGPEIRGKTQRIFHQHSLDVVLKEMVQWATEGADKLGCLPCVLIFGIGRSNVEAASLALEAAKEGDFSVQSDLEKRITDAVNESGIGPLGLGGKNTVLATFLKVGPQRASGVRIVSMRVGCCFDPRRATLTLNK